MATKPVIQQRSHRVRIDVAIIPCSDENESAHPVRRYVDFTVPGNQIIFENGTGNAEAVRLAGAMAMQAMQSGMDELMTGFKNQPKIARVA